MVSYCIIVCRIVSSCVISYPIKWTGVFYRELKHLQNQFDPHIRELSGVFLVFETSGHIER